jgi:hypothetical protein
LSYEVFEKGGNMFGRATSLLRSSTADNVTRDYDRVIAALGKITLLPRLDNFYLVDYLLEFRDSVSPTSHLNPADRTVLELFEELLAAKEKAMSVSPPDAR